MTAGPLPVREFLSAAEMQAHYARLRAATWAPRPVLKVAAPAPVAPPDAAIPEPDRELTREAYRKASAELAAARKQSLKDRKPMADMARIVSAATGFSVAHLKSPRRPAALAKARQIAMWLMVRHARRSTVEAGLWLGGRDHTSVLHGARRVDAAIVALGLSAVTDPVELATALWSGQWPRWDR